MLFPLPVNPGHKASRKQFIQQELDTQYVGPVCISAQRAAGSCGKQASVVCSEQAVWLTQCFSATAAEWESEMRSVLLGVW